jgi:large subunit ribosomal protein L15e
MMKMDDKEDRATEKAEDEEGMDQKPAEGSEEKAAEAGNDEGTDAPESAAVDEEAPKEPRKKNRKAVYNYIGKAWNHPEDYNMEDLIRNRKVEWRRGESFVRMERPTRLDRARALGYKAKEGFVVVRARVRRGGLRKRTIKGGRKPKAKGIKKITMAKNIQRIAEERTAKRYPNLEVLNSYWTGQDGRYKYYEVLLVDPHHPSVKNDPKINWICDRNHRGRAFRGLTSAGKKGRGLMHKGKGAEKVRPSIGSHKGRGK